MPRKTSKISPKTIGIVMALVVPMLLVPTSGQARSDRSDWRFLDQPIKVKQSDRGVRNTQKSDRQSLRNLFDGSAPRKSRTMNKARNKTMGRTRDKRSSRSRRHGNSSSYYYEDEFAQSCVTPRRLHRQLRRQGWRNFHNLRIRPNVLSFKARQVHQRNGGRDLTYNLSIDRCSGALIKAKLQRQDMWYIRWMRRISSLY